jgi:putative ABC transport system substrate-binding protein
MRRRSFIAGLGSAAAWPVVAQQAGIPTVGFLDPGSPPGRSPPFREGLREMGFVEGRNVVVDYSWAEDRFDRMPALVAELVSHRVAVIVVFGTAALVATKAATKSIPIVFLIGSDPVETGFVASLNRPGGNLTGIYNVQLEVTAKRLELLHKAVPTATLIACLVNPTNPVFAEAEIKELQIAARVLGVRLLFLNASDPNEFEGAFATLVRERAGALVVGSDALFKNHSDQLVALAARHGVPAIYDMREPTAAGGLLSYGADIPDAIRMVGVYAGRILKGDKTADLPVQQVTKVELVINMKTAKLLGLDMPETLLATADEVIK